MPSLLELPTELRYEIFSSVTWTRTPPPDSPETSQDRVRLRDGWDIWVEVYPRPLAPLTLLLACKTLHNDVRHLVSSGGATYELDIEFVPGCGLFPTWTRCPLPSQTHIHTLRASFRVPNADDIDGTIAGTQCTFAKRFRGCSFDFSTKETYPNPPARRMELLPPPRLLPRAWAREEWSAAPSSPAAAAPSQPADTP